MPTDNKSLVRRVFEELWNQGKLENANQIFDADYVEHDPATPNTGRGVDSFRTMYDTYHAAFPDTRFTIEDTILGPRHRKASDPARYAAFFGLENSPRRPLYVCA